MQVQKEVTQIIEFLQKNIGDKTPVLAVSGGVDSALTLMLLSKAFGPERVKAFFLPESSTPAEDYADVESLADASGVHIQTVSIQPMVNAFRETLGVTSVQSLGNIKSRIRMIILYYQANVSNGMVVGTTNRSEYIVGYFTKFGDGGCDIEPIMHLLKGKIWELSRVMNVPEKIISKKPSAGLWAGQTDESELGMSYEVLDNAIIEIFDRGKQPSGQPYERVLELYNKSAHKRVLPVSLET